MRALSEGTARRDAYGFAVAGERLGASWRAATDWDWLRCGFEVPAAELGAATELLAEAVRTPGFAPETLARVRDERLDEVRIERSQPMARGMEALAATVFADTSRYSRSDGGTEESVAAVTADDIGDFHATAFGSSRVALLVVGDLDGVDVDSLGRTAFDGWAGKETTAASPDVAVAPPRRRVVVIDRPGSVQSVLCAGHQGPPRQVEDYVAMTTMSMVLGGMFSSRLNLKLREEKGYAYGAFGSFDTRRDGGMFVARSSVASNVTVPALVDMVGEIERMHADGVEVPELEAAQAYRAGVYPLNFAGSLAVAFGLGEIVANGFDDDHFDRLRADVLAVGKSAVDAAAASRLRPDDLAMVVVGDASSFLDDLRAADLGPVEVLADEA
jgi:predicted Zn-dependent peptidase